MDNQLSLINLFKGDVFVTAGENEWKNDGHKSLDKLEKYIQENNKAKFYPNNGCPLKKMRTQEFNATNLN